MIGKRFIIYIQGSYHASCLKTPVTHIDGPIMDLVSILEGESLHFYRIPDARYPRTNRSRSVPDEAIAAYKPS